MQAFTPASYLKIHSFGGIILLGVQAQSAGKAFEEIYDIVVGSKAIELRAEQGR